MKSTITLFASVMLCTLSACAAKPGTASRTFRVGHFDEIECSSLPVEVVVGPATGKVVVTAPAGFIDRIKVERKDDELEISRNRGFGFSSNDLKGVKIQVTVPYVESIEASNGAVVSVKGRLQVADEIDITAKSGAVVNIGNLNCRKMDVEASSGSVVNVDEGTAAEAEIEAGSGSVVESGVKVDRGSVRASSGAVVNSSIRYANTKATFGAVIENTPF